VKLIFANLTKPTRLHGVWRYPGETTDVPEGHAQEYVARCLATTRVAQPPPAGGTGLRDLPANIAPHPSAGVLRDGETSAQPGADASRATPRLFLNGCPVECFPKRVGIAVSVIVPLYRSARFLPGLLRSLRNSDPTPRETIFVSDGDGQPDVPGKLVALHENRGFAPAVNEGARRADGEFLCLLNADVEVRPNWLAPMVELIRSDPRTGAVGNRNLDRDGRIDSVGSEFSHASGNFEHVLLGAADAPRPERDAPTDRDMITAACLLVRRSLWEDLGGLDEAYRVAYFEDSDLCMRIRRAGYRVVYCPDSVIVHHKNHSGAGRHPFYRRNKRLFHERWVETGQVDRFARQRGRKVHGGDVVACYIVLNEEEYIQASIESVYPLADRIDIVEGGNDYAVAAGLCGADKRSADATVERIDSADDPDGKIELVRGAWRDKAEQRQEYAKRLKPDDWMLLMDGDEVFYEFGLWRLSYLMRRQEIVRPMFDLFWNDFQTVGTGVWDRFPQVKVVRWRAGYRYRDHNCPCDSLGKPIVTSKTHGLVRERLYAHYAWVKPIEKLRRKAAYYEHQPGAREHMRKGYIENVFLPWRERPLSVVEQFGTHPFGGGGAAPFHGEHPEPIRRRLATGEFSWTT